MTNSSDRFYHMSGLGIGLAGGLLGGILGIGGGIIMVPLMTGLAKITQHQAHGTSLVAIVFTALAGAGTYLLHGHADWKVAAILAVTAIFFARFGALFAHSLPEKKLKKAFGAFLGVVSLMLFFKGYIPTTPYTLGSGTGILIFLVIGCFTGFIAGMMGVGGGAVMIPPMVILGGMSQHLAQGTSLLAMVPVSVTGALTHYRLGNVKVAVAWGLALGSLIGGYFGARAATVIPEAYLRFIFAGVGLWMSIRYLRA